MGVQKTLLLVFIHGFKGGETTFGPGYRFTDELRDSVAESLPRVRIQLLVYPKYETRGDLKEAVERFRAWLYNKVADLERKARPGSDPPAVDPTVDSTVHTILIGHSMGGIVAAETTLSLATDSAFGRRSGSGTPSHVSRAPSPNKKPDDPTASSPPPSTAVSSTTANAIDPSVPLNPFMFPYIQGVLAFDTPYMGISPGVVAHTAEGHITTANNTLNIVNDLRSVIWGNSPSSSATNAAKQLPSVQSAASSTSSAAAATAATKSGGWGKWSTVAMVAGAVGALAAGGTAAYINREHLSDGWGWATSHLEFVGCLARKEELRRRVAAMVRLRRELRTGFANIYTRLGGKATSKTTVVGTVIGRDRTFCNLPKNEEAGEWREAVNESATDEIWAHMNMFEEKSNPKYRPMIDEATQLIVKWVDKEWYEESERRIKEAKDSPRN